MAKAKESGSLRQRKAEKAPKDETAKDVKTTPPAPAKSSSPKPAGKTEKGMTCFNWFLVIFLTTALCGVSTLLLFQLIQFEIAAVRMKISSIKDVGNEMKTISNKIEVLGRLDQGINALKKNEGERSAGLTKLSKEQEKFSSTFKKEISELRELISALESSAISSSEMAEVKDKLEVSSADVAQLVKEVSRLDKIFSEYREQILSIQQEVINLTADKTAMTTAIESIKSTVVHVREDVQKMQKDKGEGQRSALSDEFEKKVVKELEELQRQISEISGNSVEWLEKSTSAIEGRFKKSVEDLAKQFAELKVGTSEPDQASADQSVLNSIATLSEKIERTDDRIVQLGDVIAKVGENQKKTDSLVTEQFGDSSESLSALSQKVTESQNRDQEMWKAVADVTEEFIKVRNELNSVKTIARILETRIDELRTGKSEQAPEPAAAPDMPADAIPDPDPVSVQS